MLQRIRDFAYMQPWTWALLWGALLALLIAALTDAPWWEVLLYASGFFLAVGLVRSSQGRRRGRT